MRQCWVALLAYLLATIVSYAAGFELPPNCTQCVVGIADHWNTSNAQLTLYEKRGDTWQRVGESWNARLGKSGLVWGLGLHPVPHGATTKTEGDLRSPAGVFSLGGVWGYAATIRKHPKLFYHQVTSRDLWVEDPNSPAYNRFVMLDHEPTTSWEKKEQMKQGDPVHSLKLFIAHNAPPKTIPGAGSSIFFHIWRNDGGRATAGCTTMPEDRLKHLIAWINPDRNPTYVLLPKADYAKLRTAWRLP